MLCIHAIKAARNSLAALLLTLLSAVICLPANAEGAEILEVNTRVDGATLEPGETKIWSIYVPEGAYDFMIDVQSGSPAVTIDRGDGFPEYIPSANGYNGFGGYASFGVSWTITIEAQTAVGASYSLYLGSAPPQSERQ